MSWPDTYSQYDEQQAILAVADRIRSGKARFLDVGAWDPICFSNTRALFERGWSGVMIEPSPTPMLSLLKEYGNEERITLLQAALSVEEGIQQFFMTDDSVSSSNVEQHAQWKGQAKFLGCVFVRTVTWAQLNNWYGGFDFVNIDAEGYSVDLFHAMLASGHKPTMTCVEHDNRLPELAQAATAVGYKMVYANGTNGVFAL